MSGDQLGGTRQPSHELLTHRLDRFVPIILNRLQSCPIRSLWEQVARFHAWLLVASSIPVLEIGQRLLPHMYSEAYLLLSAS